MDKQEIYINLDDSGKLTRKENISVYGGIVFFSQSERDKYVNIYKDIINTVKCDYCKQDNYKCNKKCPEIKNTNIRNKDKRRILNFSMRYYIIALIIKNDEIYDNIVNDKASRGRFTDYAIKMLIKEVIKTLISKKIINPNKPLKIILDIDQQSTKSNGYYNLADSIKEELKYGITNFDYGMKTKPILHNDLEVKLTYRISKLSYTIQAADLIAGTVRKKSIEAYKNKKDIESNLDFIDYKIIFPRKKTT